MMEEARKALRDMLALKPNYAQVARELHGRWIEPDLVESAAVRVIKPLEARK